MLPVMQHALPACLELRLQLGLLLDRIFLLGLLLLHCLYLRWHLVLEEADPGPIIVLLLRRDRAMMSIYVYGA